MKCPPCQHEDATSQRFCEECGAHLASVCSSCGASNPLGQCRAPLTRSVGRKFASPGTYTPHHLAEETLTSKGALEGERKQIAVLFAELIAIPRRRNILDSTPERMNPVHRFASAATQVRGDGIMALFGAPVAREDHRMMLAMHSPRRLTAARRAP